MNNRSILISGASVAGPALASWLGASGWDVTVVERVDHLREEGQNIDVRGLGRQVLRRMGLEDAVRAAHTGETGIEVVDQRGRVIASFGAGGADTGGGTAELEVLRGQLSSLIHGQSADKVEYRFGDQITALHDDGAGVDVEFLHGPGRRFDSVVIAEGLRSRTRALVMSDAHVHELGLYIGYLAIPRKETDTDRLRALLCGRGRMLYLRPDNVGTTQSAFSFLSDVRGLDRIDREELISIVRKTYADVGWEVPRVLDALDNGSLYFEDIGQAKLPAFSRGRIGLVGDSAYCASPISGMGTTLALTGAYILAGELTGQDDPGTAFARYEQRMRPLVASAQKLPPATPRIISPRSNLERTLLHGALRATSAFMASRIGGLAGKLAPSKAESITLPNYSMPSPEKVPA